MSPLPHGGRLAEARRRHPAAPDPWLDLSTGINPSPYSFAPPPADAWCRLPEDQDLAALESAAARAYRVADPAMVVAAPGTQALIQLLPRLLPQAEVAIVGPTYAEHAATWSAAGAQVRDVGEPQHPATILCNPNNPDGRRHDPAALAAFAATADLLVVDEAFADFDPALSLAPALPLPRVVILRSFGKAYGLAGLRLGFALAEPALADRIRIALGPWPVSGPALRIGHQALSDIDWRTAAAQAATAMGRRLDEVLTQSGLTILGGTALFRLAHAADAAALEHRLGNAGILVRSFAHLPGRLRFGLPPDETALRRLAEALAGR